MSSRNLSNNRKDTVNISSKDFTIVFCQNRAYNYNQPSLCHLYLSSESISHEFKILLTLLIQSIYKFTKKFTAITVT